MTLMAAPPSRTFARLTGAAYLCIAVFGGFAFFMVSEQLRAPGDAAATAARIAADEPLFRAGLAAYMVTLGLDVLVAWMLFRLMRAADEPLARLAAWLRLAYVCLHGAAVLQLPAILRVLDGGFAKQDPAFAAEMIQHHMQAHLDGFMLSLMLFGAHLLALGWLIIQSRILPRVIGGLVMLAGSAYLIDGFAFTLMTDYAAFYRATQTPIAMTAVIGEVSLLGWLLVRGTNSDAPDR